MKFWLKGLACIAALAITTTLTIALCIATGLNPMMSALLTVLVPMSSILMLFSCFSTPYYHRHPGPSSAVITHSKDNDFNDFNDFWHGPWRRPASVVIHRPARVPHSHRHHHPAPVATFFSNTNHGHSANHGCPIKNVAPFRV